ncbi:MAG: hypothetical protein ACOCPN_01895 [Desulfonatronovibrionaceae bacterium]
MAGRLAMMLALTFILGLAKVWVNIQRVDLSYRMQTLQSEYSENMELRTKLRIEKNNLLSPYRLREEAEQKDMFSPDERRIRKLQE